MVRKDDVFGDGTWRAREGDAESRTRAFYHLFPGIGRFLSHSVLALHTGVSGALHQGSSWRAWQYHHHKGHCIGQGGRSQRNGGRRAAGGSFGFCIPWIQIAAGRWWSFLIFSFPSRGHEIMRTMAAYHVCMARSELLKVLNFPVRLADAEVLSYRMDDAWPGSNEEDGVRRRMPHPTYLVDHVLQSRSSDDHDRCSTLDRCGS